jgi:hypothetical protein
MNFGYAAVLLAGVVVFAGCGTERGYRSADLSSDSAYRKTKSPELKENDVLGLNVMGDIGDREIRQILEETRTLNVQQGSNILVVQSGAPHPDKEMTEQLARHFTVIPHTGVPAELNAEADGNISKALRLAGAHAKAETVLVYWGKMEIKRDDLPTGLVSWVPVIDFMVPDEYQKVRVYLKVALIDVRTGQWATFRTEPLEEQTLTTRYAREKEPNWPLGPVKSRAYEACVRKLLEGYVLAQR